MSKKKSDFGFFSILHPLIQPHLTVRIDKARYYPFLVFSLLTGGLFVFTAWNSFDEDPFKQGTLIENGPSDGAVKIPKRNLYGLDQPVIPGGSNARIIYQPLSRSSAAVLQFNGKLPFLLDYQGLSGGHHAPDSQGQDQDHLKTSRFSSGLPLAPSPEGWESPESETEDFQITITNSVFPVVGDTLRYAIDNQPGQIVMTPPGGGQTWNFSNLGLSTTFNEIMRDPMNGVGQASFPGAGLLYNPEGNFPVSHFQSNNTVEAYLGVTTQAVSLQGYFGGDPIGVGMELVSHYNPPITMMRAPVNFFDINQTSSGLLLPFDAAIFPNVDQLPFTADSMRIRRSISRVDAVDAWGSLTIPGGTYEVLREKRTQYTETRLDAKIQPLGWLDVTDVAIQYLGITTLGVDTLVSFHFLNDQSKEAIAICKTDNSQLQVTSVQYKFVSTPTDFGDAPDSYGTLLASNGARHQIVPGLHLGASVDAEPDGQPGADADGDDNLDGDDEDGVTIPELFKGKVAKIMVNASAAGKLDAWIDFNRNGTFADPGEKITDTLFLGAGDNLLNVDVPLNASEGVSFARFRFSSTGGLNYNGSALNGEVEDYQVNISSVNFSIDNPTVMEGDIGTSNLVFTVSRNSNDGNASVNYAITGGTATTADNDYEPLIPDTLIFLDGGPLSQTITVLVNGDDKVEPDETVIISLSSPVGGSLAMGMGQGTGTIMNDDMSTLSISNPVLVEGNTDMTEVCFTIALSQPLDTTFSFQYTTQDGTATTADNDYSLRQGFSQISKGLQSVDIKVPVMGDCTPESDEMFSLVLSGFQGGSGVFIPTTIGTATIENDDAPPDITCPADRTEKVECGIASKLVTLNLPVTGNLCGSGNLEFRYRPVSETNVPTGPYTAYAPSENNTLSFNLGKYEIEWRITDGSGSSTCSHYLEVKTLTIEMPVIQGPTTFCPALSGIPYSVSPQPGVVSYQWAYSASGVTINHNGTPEVTLDFSMDATAGTLTVTLMDACGGADAIGQINISVGNLFTCLYVDCLINNLNVTNETLALPGMPQVFKIGGQITSDATIQSPKTILFKAGQSVSLNPEFKVNQGAVFVAEIEDCPLIFPFIMGN
jgi:hypothetical protein